MRELGSFEQIGKHLLGEFRSLFVKIEKIMFEARTLFVSEVWIQQMSQNSLFCEGKGKLFWKKIPNGNCAHSVPTLCALHWYAEKPE